jgi:SAM-dependent methyltransferase
MHEGVSNYLAGFVKEAERGLDIGGRDINGHPRGLWPDVKWDVMDVREGDGVTQVWDATIPLTEFNETFDLIICTETFEHVAGWEGIVRNAAAWLKPDGLFLTTCAGPGFGVHSAIDGEWRLLPGEHYCNVSATEVAVAMADSGLVVLDYRQDGTFTYAAARKP